MRMMKKLPLLLVLSAILYLPLKAQRVPSKSNLKYYQKHYAPISGLYAGIDIGASYGIGQWGGSPSLDQPLLASFYGEDGFGATYGYFLSFSQMVPLKIKTDYKDSWYAGIRWGMEIAEHGILDWSNLDGDDRFTVNFDEGEENSYGNATNAAILLGFTESYNLGNKFVIETGFDLHLSVWSIRPNISYFGRQSNYTVLPEAAENGDNLAWQPGYSFHLAYRARNVRIYLKYFNQAVNQYYEVTNSDLQGNEISTEGFNSDFNISTLRLGISFLFGQI